MALAVRRLGATWRVRLIGEDRLARGEKLLKELERRLDALRVQMDEAAGAAPDPLPPAPEER